MLQLEMASDGNGNWVSKEGGLYGNSGCCCGAYDAYGREKMPRGTLVKMRQEMMSSGCRRYIFDGRLRLQQVPSGRLLQLRP
jgi:hypothetical protein